jgi:hypothetical protein
MMILMVTDGDLTSINSAAFVSGWSEIRMPEAVTPGGRVVLLDTADNTITSIWDAEWHEMPNGRLAWKWVDSDIPVYSTKEYDMFV